MKTGNIGVVILMFFIVLCSCKEQNTDEPEHKVPMEDGVPSVSLRVSTLNVNASESSGVSEKIRSLRIVMLSDGFVEYNNKIDFTTEGAAKSATDFIQTIERSTVPGNKSFYVIANEQSVGKVGFSCIDTELPEWLGDDTTLEDILNHYTKDKLPSQGTFGYSNSGSGSEFEMLMNAAYFKPDYTIGADNAIYLPYTSYYTGYVSKVDAEETLEASIFLVPVATKFTFNLKNFRREKVKLYGIELNGTNIHNYVMANLDDSEKTKTLNGKSYYWIDWLEKVSEGSQNAGGSADYNNKAGWIENYFMPNIGDEEDGGSIANDVNIQSILPSTGESWNADALTNIDNPSTIKITRYFSESRNMGKKSVFNSDKNIYEDVDAQIYKVRFTVQEIREDGIETEITTSDWMPLEAVNSLFRNTHVVVNVDMYESIVEIYCQIEEWKYNKTPFLGYVQEDDDD